MRRFGKLRTRLLSSIRKRSARNGDGSSPEDHRAGSSSPQAELHWSEARRIYSEPAASQFKVERGSSEESSSDSICAGGHLQTGGGGKSEVTPAEKRHRDGESDSQCGESDGEDDDVFLDSWEEAPVPAGRAGNDHSTANLSSSSGIGSLRENTTSAASGSYFNGPSASPQHSISMSPLPLPTDELYRHSLSHRQLGPDGSRNGNGFVVEQELEGCIELTGWEEWKISGSEITLGAVLHQSQLETVYSGYWHGGVQVHTRLVKEVLDVVSFLNEVATLNCIRHENIQLFMGASLDLRCGTVALVMSELKGSTLFTRLHKLGHNFTAPSKTRILRQIAEGMEYLHDKGIPHGLLTTTCITLHCRVCISLAPPHNRHAHRYFTANQLTYLPPECVRQLRVDQAWHVSPVRRVSTSSLGAASPSCVTCEKTAIMTSRSRAPSSPSLVSVAMAGGNSSSNNCQSCKILKRKSESMSAAGGSPGSDGRELQLPHTTGSQLKCSLSPTTAADMFAFGTVVYELLSLEYPYKHLSSECLIWQVGHGRTQPLSLLPKGRFRNIVSGCWREKPERRPTFTDLLVHLEDTAIPLSSRSVSSPSSSRLKPSHSLPSLNSAPNTISSPSHHFAK